MVYQDRELPKLLYKNSQYGSVMHYLGKETGGKIITDKDYLQRVLDKTEFRNEFRILSDEEAEKFIKDNF